MWVGLYWDRKNRVLYICPLPCIVISLTFEKKQPQQYRDKLPPGYRKIPPEGVPLYGGSCRRKPHKYK